MLLFLQLAGACEIDYRIRVDWIGKCGYEEPSAVDFSALAKLCQDGLVYGNGPGFWLHFYHGTKVGLRDYCFALPALNPSLRLVPLDHPIFQGYWKIVPYQSTVPANYL